MVTIFDDDLIRALQKHRTHFIFTKHIKKPYIFTKKIEVNKLSFQDGDGDCVFY